MYSLKNVRNILLITLLFYFIFAVVGVQLFKVWISKAASSTGFSYIFLNAKSEWETGSELRGREREMVASEEFERREPWFPAPFLAS